jgi:hypothetical protein
VLSPHEAAASSQKRARTKAMRRISAGCPELSSLVMASVAMRRKTSSPKAMSAAEMERTSCRIAQAGELTSRSRR